MNLSNKHVAVLVHNYFEQAEFEEPIRALKDAGAEVTVIAVEQTTLHGMNHADPGDTFQADLLLPQANPGDYDGLVLPGGVINSDSLRKVAAAQEFMLDFLDNGKPLAVICHAPWLMVSADAVEGKRLTSYYTIEDDITNAGGEWINQPLVVDGNLITSRQPDDLPQFNQALVKALAGQESSAVPVGADGDSGLGETSNKLRSLGYDRMHDEIDNSDASDILTDNDQKDPDELHPSSVVSDDER